MELADRDEILKYWGCEAKKLPDPERKFIRDYVLKMEISKYLKLGIRQKKNMSYADGKQERTKRREILANIVAEEDDLTV